MNYFHKIQLNSFSDIILYVQHERKRAPKALYPLLDLHLAILQALDSYNTDLDQFKLVFDSLQQTSTETLSNVQKEMLHAIFLSSCDAFMQYIHIRWRIENHEADVSELSTQFIHLLSNLKKAIALNEYNELEKVEFLNSNMKHFYQIIKPEKQTFIESILNYISKDRFKEESITITRHKIKLGQIFDLFLKETDRNAHILNDTSYVPLWIKAYGHYLIHAPFEELNYSKRKEIQTNRYKSQIIATAVFIFIFATSLLFLLITAIHLVGLLFTNGTTTRSLLIYFLSLWPYFLSLALVGIF